jgi:predicted alpha-1,2-mannosidase
MRARRIFRKLSRSIGRRGAVVLAILVLALLLGVVAAESLSGSSQGSPSPGTTPTISGNPNPLENLTQYVDPFIGTGDSSPYPCQAACGGDVFPGADFPNGMVQWSPDTPSNPPGGYYYGDSVIKDFSLTHFSGRGCEVYQDVPFMPYVGGVSVSPAANASLYYSAFSHANETARPGYYRVHLDGPDVTAELSATLHTGIGEFVYPASTASTMLINAGGSVNGNSNSMVSIDPGGDEVTGSAQSVVGCGSNSYVIYFAAKFDRSFSAYGTWNGNAVDSGSKSSGGQHAGAFVVFDTTSNPVVVVQVGVSFVSVANAQLNLASEGAGFNLASVAEGAASAWNADLNSIQVQGGTQNDTVIFYTALYHVFFNPNVFSDVNGQYLGFDGKVHTVPKGHVQYENIPGWDAYRTHMQLLSIISPSIAGDIAQSLVNDAQQGDGALPRWEQANADSLGMSGDDGDIVVADAYAFGATDFDTAGALQAMVGGQAHIREGYTLYASLGYLPADSLPSLSTASITLEYASDDFAIAQFASALGDSADYNTYLQRSGDWQDVFNVTSGYAQPRDADGTWAQGFSPASENGFQEGDSAQYTWMVPFDLSGLFGKMGGDSTAVSRLDSFFTALNGGPVSPFAWMGNEPSVEVPWEYDFAQAPSQTQQVVREIQTKLWSNTAGGMPGNDDGGEMSSWYVFAAMGIYPEIPGVAGFVIGSPLFPSISLYLPGGHTLQVDAPAASDSQPYVEGLQVNGSATSSLWLPWAAVKGGATLEFTLGPSPSGWGSSPQDAPPSFPP